MLYITSMDERLSRAVEEALEATLASMQTVADEAGLHQTTLARWRMGTVAPSPESALKLASVLKARAVRLLEAAAHLEAQAQAEGGNE